MSTARLVITEKFYSYLFYSKILFDTLNVKKESIMMPAEKEKSQNVNWFEIEDQFQKEMLLFNIIRNLIMSRKWHYSGGLYHIEVLMDGVFGGKKERV